MNSAGLSSKDATQILVKEANSIIENWENNPRPSPRDGIFACDSDSHASHYCSMLLFYLFASAIFLAIGAVDLENEVSYSLLAVSGFLLAYLFMIITRQQLENKKESSYRERKATKLLNSLAEIDSELNYSTIIEPLTEDMWGQLGLRDGKRVNIPKMLLVKGDTILVRPGQVLPCACTTVEGEKLKKGDRFKRVIEVDEYSDGTTQLKAIPATVEESLINNHISAVLEVETGPSILDRQIKFVVHVIYEKIILPISIVGVTVAVAIRYFCSESDSLFGSRFIFSIGPIILLPLICPVLPIILYWIKRWNNSLVFGEFGAEKDPYFPKDCLSLLGSLTGVSVVDKKGLLSPLSPSLDKIILFRDGEDGVDVEPEVMDLSSEMLENGKWGLYFDDPSWQEYAANLSPIALNVQLNSCRHNLPYFAFLDHLSCVSDTVPRTIVTANRRCMCLFPPLMGFRDECSQQFVNDGPPQLIGFYKREPGDAPVPGLTTHRTPLEMAFCSLHADERSIHSHVSCQGTAGIVLEACTHVWNGRELTPLSARLSRVVRDLSHRHSMTGYCLTLSYRATGFSLDSKILDKYIEVPLSRTNCTTNGFLPRSHSFDDLLRSEFFAQRHLKKADEVIENMFTGHTLCGMVVMQYEALPCAVQLVDGLENNCIRFVYFSRENELRSRVFAEKLGLEAGWNCHVSLASENEESDRKTSKDVFLSRVPKHHEQWTETPKIRRKRNSQLCRSELLLPGSGFDVLSRISPFRRRSSSSAPDKVGPMPNKAQLPTGVKAIRPHLEEVDNVPLLVGLFTDCSPAANADMVEIMQEYGEVVLSIGSSLNMANIDVFTQSDLSICVTPPIDSNCCKEKQPSLASEFSSANYLAGKIMGLSTDFQLDSRQLVHLPNILPDLISSCRHRLASIRYSLFFLLLSNSLLSLTLFLSTVLFLPIMFTTGQVILTVFLQIPLLFVGIVCIPFKPTESVIRIAAKNSSYFSRSAVTSSFFTFFVQFAPTACFLIVTFFLSLIRNSTMLCSFSDVVCSLGVDMGKNLSTDQIRHVLGFHLIIYLCISSVSWVYPLSSFTSQIPVTSPPWLAATTLCLLSQVIFSYSQGMYVISEASLQSWIMLVVWGTILLLSNELWKHRRIRQFQREQRRTKLAFDTKLGMNSPY